MDSKAGKGPKDFRKSPGKSLKDHCPICYWAYDSNRAKDVRFLAKRLEEVHRLRKHLDSVEDTLNTLKTLNDDFRVSESDILSATSLLDQSDLDGLAPCCGLVEKFSGWVSRVESVLSGKAVRNLTKLLEDCRENMLGFQVGLKEFQYIGAMESEIKYLKIQNIQSFQNNMELSSLSQKVLDLNKEMTVMFNNKYKIKRKSSF